MRGVRNQSNGGGVDLHRWWGRALAPPSSPTSINHIPIQFFKPYFPNITNAKRVILRGLFRDGCFGKWGTNQKDGSALGIVDATPLSIPFGTVLCSSDGDTRGCLDTSCMIVRGTILRLARIPVMEVTVSGLDQQKPIPLIECVISKHDAKSKRMSWIPIWFHGISVAERLRGKKLSFVGLGSRWSWIPLLIWSPRLIQFDPTDPFGRKYAMDFDM
ncbi:hypothetical protein Tco_1015094 [Tanacetum coccineum]|uniref:Uncharacterized protein n=1 Tax=Tanacetum coccineum TaxID=301880 RepID=A0ABQ5FKD4_9ASTR